MNTRSTWLRPSRRTTNIVAALALCCAGAVLAGCQQPMSYARSPNFDRGISATSVLVMPMDVELAELTTGGMLEPQAEWTQQARSYLSELLSEELQKTNVQRADYQPPADPERERANAQVLKLHEAVGGTISRHYFLPKATGQTNLLLPTKQNFDWSLGPAVSRLRDEYGSDYALFLFVRDSYSSAGRVALQIVTALLIGYVPPGGAQVGFASLVDLRTGDVVWFNQLARGSGDLRNREAAREAIAALLKDFPK